MTAFMIIVIILLFVVLLSYTWYKLEAYEDIEKILLFVSGILLSWAITHILFMISSSGLNYEIVSLKNQVGKVLVLVFTPINGIIYMPYMARIMSKFKFDEIDEKEFTKKFLILIAILIVIFIIEVMYLRNIQLGIFELIRK